MDLNTLANIAWEAHAMNIEAPTEKDQLMFKSGFIIAFKIQELEKNKIMKQVQQAVAKAKEEREKQKAIKEAVIGDDIEENT